MKYKLITLLALLSIAGCSDVDQVNGNMYKDSEQNPVNQFLFTQEYGYCNDTTCVGESIILKDFSSDNSRKCYYFTIVTGDTLHNELYLDKFLLSYNLTHNFSVDFGNGYVKSFDGLGNYEIKYYCNTQYEVIICYE